MSNKVTSRQAVRWLILYYWGSAILFLPAGLAIESKQDAWMAVILGVGLQLICIPLLIALSRRMKGRTFPVFMEHILGRTAARMFVFAFTLCFPFLIMCFTLRNLGDFIVSSILVGTPLEAVHFLVLMASVYGVARGADIIGKSVELIYPVVWTLILILIISVLPNYEWNSLLPMLEHGPLPVVRASLLLFAFPYMEAVLLTGHLLKDPAEIKGVFVKSTLLSGIGFLLATIASITVLHADITAQTMYPSYLVARTVSIADFYERIEILLSIIWLVTIYFRLTLLLEVSNTCLTYALNMKKPHTLLIPLSIITLVMANVVWPNSTYLTEFLGVWPSYAMVFGLGVPAALLLVALIRKKRKAPAKNEPVNR
ncbi:GerAB/ArcD/ProY family transporter [Paenibacillus gansuensis]|uniref:Endospore germination permease n=1 Tax=Paenibacillus gansuensis TaxID=306542 RepID=A0ABW5PEM1_9BACL